MIIIEFILMTIEIVLVKPFSLLAKFIIWIFTARDCEHCKWSYKNYWDESVCSRHSEEEEECKESIHRKHFKRER